MNPPLHQSDATTPAWRWLLLIALPVVLNLAVQAPAEPVFNGDSNRHVMTSVFFRDLLTDLPTDPQQYARDYYDQYPALGLLIWPPLFHGVTGLAMLVFGTSVWVARGIVFASFGLAAVCLYRICRRRIPAEQSALVTVLFSSMPMIFLYSRHVMLEMPTLALCLLSIERFDLWLRGVSGEPHGASRGLVITSAPAASAVPLTKHVFPWSLYVAAIAASLAALTRFDAVMLLPTLLLMAIFDGRWKALFNRHIVFAAVVAILLLAPTYYLVWREMGDLHMRQAAESVSGNTSQMFASGSLWFYPSKIGEQAGWAVAAFLIFGVVAAIQKRYRAGLGVFAALLIGTYVTFTPLAELRSRHSIYWLPAVAWFAVIGADFIGAGLARLQAWLGRDPRPVDEDCRRCSILPHTVLLCATVVMSFHSCVYHVTGYEQAAALALQQTEPGDRIFTDGWWDGNLTYHLRHLDKSRSRHVVRADKVLYDFTNVPTVDFQQFVESDLEMLQAIADVNPACIVFEDPQPFGEIEISRRMRALIRSMPQEFPPLDVVVVQSTVPQARDVKLFVFGVNPVRLRESIASPGKWKTTRWETGQE